MLASGIYAIVNIANDKLYVGSAVNFRNRWKNHKIELRLNRHCNIYLQAAYNKHGENSLLFTVIEYVERDKLIEREQYWIDQTKCYDREIGYNLCAVAGNVLGRKASDETKALLSSMRKGKPRSEETKRKIALSWLTRKVSDEARANMAKAQTGRKLSEETKAKMSEMRKGNQVNLGRKQSPEEIEKRANSNRGKKRSLETRLNIAKSITGRIVSEETRLKMSLAAKNRRKCGQAENFI